MLHLQEVEARRRHGTHVGLLGLLVATLVPALFPLPQEARPALIRLAHENDVGEAFKVVLLHADP